MNYTHRPFLFGFIFSCLLVSLRPFSSLPQCCACRTTFSNAISIAHQSSTTYMDMYITSVEPGNILCGCQWNWFTVFFLCELEFHYAAQEMAYAFVIVCYNIRNIILVLIRGLNWLTPRSVVCLLRGLSKRGLLSNAGCCFLVQNKIKLLITTKNCLKIESM